MRLLLDECVPVELKNSFDQYHECLTITKRSQFRGLKNGVLLQAAEKNGVDVLVTVDKNFAYQQRLEGRRIALLVLETRGTKLSDLLPLCPAALKALANLSPGAVTTVRSL